MKSKAFIRSTENLYDTVFYQKLNHPVNGLNVQQLITGMRIGKGMPDDAKKNVSKAL